MFNAKALSGGLLILVSLLALGACDQTKRYTDQEHVQKAKELQDQGNLDSAVIELKNALQQNPKNLEARSRLGEIYVSQELGEPAESELNRAKEFGMDFEALKVPMGQALLLQGLYQRVLAEIHPAPNSPPGNLSKILEIQGRAKLGLRQFDDGCRLFAQSLEKNPQYVPSYWGLARCAAARGKLDEARMELDKAIKLEEKNSDTWAMLGDLERATKRFPDAEAAYANALKYKGNNVDALLGRAIGKIDSNKLDEANQDIDAALKVARNSLMGNQLRGVIQFKQGKFAAAEGSFQTVLKTQPGYLPAVLWLGLTNLEQKNYEQASKQFAEYTRSVPSAGVQAMLALTQARQGHGQAAAETLKVLRDVDVTDPQSLALLAQANISVGETDLAATYLSKAIKQRPEAADLRVELATVLGRKGERAQAIEQLESAIHLDPGMANADVLLIENLIRDKQFDKALQAVASLEKKQPKNPTTYNLKGSIYVAKNDFANARKSFEQAMSLDVVSVAAAMNLAQLDLREKNPEAARQRFEAVLSKDKNNVQAMMGLAGVASATGKESEYVAWMEKAAQTAPSDVRPRVFLADYYLKKNDVQKALALAREAQTAHPTDAQAMDALGTVQLAAGENENAVVTYGKLVNVIPKSAVAHYKLAVAQAATRNMGAARTSLSKALALRPAYLDAEILLASVELSVGHHADALKIVQQIQAQYPESASGFVLQGEILMAQKQFAAALAAYEKALAINNTGLLAVKVHQALRAGGRAKDADARLLLWLNDHPDDVTARVYLAETYMNAGPSRQAVEQFELVLQSNPKNVLALNNLAWLYQQAKDPRALAAAEQAYQLAPESPEILDTLGWILVGQGETARGLKLLQKAAETAPESAVIRYHWAAALAKSGDSKRARTELAGLLGKSKTFSQRQEAQALLRQLSQ
jgi:putative PEP-CTERM system TPR-repeat lipoprotein